MSTQGGSYKKNSLQEQSKPDLRMERPDQQTSKPSSLILRFLHQNIHAATIFPLKSFVDVILIKSIFFISPNFGNQSILKSANYFPRLGWRGRCVVIKSVSTQRQRPNIFRFPISSVHKSFLSVWKSFRLQCDYTVVQDLCEMLSYLILPKVEFGTGVIIINLQ